MKKLGFVLCLMIVGCAAKPPGGGHVVGNPLAPQGMAAESCGCTGEKSCGCDHGREEKKEESCGCEGHDSK
jgi:hypothetical protein